MSSDERSPRATRLRELRLRKALSQRDLAEKAGLTHVTVSAIETGRTQPSLRSQRALAKALNIDLADLWQPVAETAR